METDAHVCCVMTAANVKAIVLTDNLRGFV